MLKEDKNSYTPVKTNGVQASNRYKISANILLSHRVLKKKQKNFSAGKEAAVTNRIDELTNDQERDRQTDRQTDRQRQRETEIETQRQTETEM